MEPPRSSSRSQRRASTSPATDVLPFRTTPRQAQLIELVGGRGLSYVEVARLLGLSVRTVEGYATEIRTLAGLPHAPRTALFMLYRDQRGGANNGEADDVDGSGAERRAAAR